MKLVWFFSSFLPVTEIAFSRHGSLGAYFNKLIVTYGSIRKVAAGSHVSSFFGEGNSIMFEE